MRDLCESLCLVRISWWWSHHPTCLLLIECLGFSLVLVSPPYYTHLCIASYCLLFEIHCCLIRIVLNQTTVSVCCFWVHHLSSWSCVCSCNDDPCHFEMTDNNACQSLDHKNSLVPMTNHWIVKTHHWTTAVYSAAASHYWSHIS